eukprot:m.125614 g.125614  ORF g.125614 m.125614 type:complete len:192 (+) comp17333_c0_seq1:440-1015(+)
MGSPAVVMSRCPLSPGEHVKVIRNVFERIRETVIELDRQHELGHAALKDVAFANEIADRGETSWSSFFSSIQQSSLKICELTHRCGLLVQQFQWADAQKSHGIFQIGHQGDDGIESDRSSERGVRLLLDVSHDLLQAHSDDVAVKELIAADVDYGTSAEILAAQLTVWEARLYVPRRLTAVGLQEYVDASS